MRSKNTIIITIIIIVSRTKFSLMIGSISLMIGPGPPQINLFAY